MYQIKQGKTHLARFDSNRQNTARTLFAKGVSLSARVGKSHHMVWEMYAEVWSRCAHLEHRSKNV